jgi:hypothetical protein
MITQHDTVKYQRRIDRKVRAFEMAAMICALFASIGIGGGLHEANPNGGWAVPIIAGIAAAVGFAIFWHSVMSAVTGMVRTTMLVAVFVIATVVTCIALGASAQAIATAIAGRAALAAELSANVDGYNKALAEAYTEATSWRGVAEAATVLAAGFRAQADIEAGGSHGTGKGQGPRWASLQEASQSFAHGADALNAMLAEAKDDQAAGDRQLGLLRDAAARGDQKALMDAVGKIGATIARLNAVDPKPIIANTGMVTASKNGIDLSKETAEFEAKADKALTDRKIVDVPVFVPVSLGEATRHQVLGSALHGWVLAGAIDVLPLLLLAMVFVMSREVWLQEEVRVDGLTFAGRNERDRDRVKNLTGRKAEDDNVYSLNPAAAE